MSRSAAYPGEPQRKDPLTELERQAVHSYKQQRLQTASSDPNELVLGMRMYSTYDISVRRSVDAVLEKETELLQLQTRFAEDDIRSLQIDTTAKQIQCDRLRELLHVTYPAKKAAIDSLRESILELERSSYNQEMESKTKLMLDAVVTLHSSTATLEGNLLAAGSTMSTCEAFLSVADTLPHERDRFEEVFMRWSKVLEGSSSSVAKLTEEWEELQRQKSANNLTLARQEFLEALASVGEVAIDKQLPKLLMLASEAATLKKHLDIERDKSNQLSLLRATIQSSKTSRLASFEDRQEQLVEARSRLEESHRDLFTLRKQLVSLQRRLANEERQGSPGAKEVTEKVRNELALGRMDYVKYLCRGGIDELFPSAAASSSGPVNPVPIFATSLQRAPLPSSSSSFTPARGLVNRSSSLMSSTAASKLPPESKPAGPSLVTAGTFQPEW